MGDLQIGGLTIPDPRDPLNQVKTWLEGLVGSTPSPPAAVDNVPQNREIHGSITDNPLLLKILDLGNQLRYGKSEAERQADVQGLRTPGVRDVAYPKNEAGQTTFDPAAAERYTSAYEFGQNYSPPEALQPLLHAISGGTRTAMNAVPPVANAFGVGPERPELQSAEQLGMQRGAQSEQLPSLSNAIMSLLMSNRGGAAFPPQ